LDGTVNAGRKGIAYLRDHYQPPLPDDAVDAGNARVLVSATPPR
jgi:hypothetical protein